NDQREPDCFRLALRSGGERGGSRRPPRNGQASPRPRGLGMPTPLQEGPRFRLLLNEVTAVLHPALPSLAVARAVWECKPDFKTACASWILAGGAHHTGYSYTVTTEMLEDFATIAGIELAVIDAGT